MEGMELQWVGMKRVAGVVGSRQIRTCGSRVATLYHALSCGVVAWKQRMVRSGGVKFMVP